MSRRKQRKYNNLNKPDFLFNLHGALKLLEATMIGIRNRESVSLDRLKFAMAVCDAFKKWTVDQEEVFRNYCRDMRVRRTLDGLEWAYEKDDEHWESRAEKVIHWIEESGLAKLSESEKIFLKSRRRTVPRSEREARTAKGLARDRFYETIAKNTLGTSLSHRKRFNKQLKLEGGRINNFVMANPTEHESWD